MNNQKYIDRLYNEWLTHKKIVVAVDFDSTVAYWPTIENQEDVNRVISIVKKAHEIGAYVVINTCSSSDRFKEIEDYCKSIKLPIDSINSSPITLPYGNTTKIYANIYLDDRAGLLEALDILERAMYGYIGYLRTNNLQI